MQQEKVLEAWLWATPNSNRVSILFEELGLHYTVHGVNIRAGAQKTPDILARNPLGRVPVVSWQDGAGPHVLFESGAILMDFANRHGALMPVTGRAREETLTWLMVVLTGLGSAMGHAHYWTALAPERSALAQDHAIGMARRAWTALEDRLDGREHLAGVYSIADIAAFPWIARATWAGLNLDDFPNLRRWYDRIAKRPAVITGMAKPEGAVLQG
jgi:GST-like protein